MDQGPQVAFTPNTRLPDSCIEVLDERILALRLLSGTVEQLASGFYWAEGPVWFGDGRYLLFSDIPNNRILPWDDCSGRISNFRHPSNHANGLSRDRQGWAYDVQGDRLADKRLFVSAEGPGACDGMAVDQAGIVWCGFGSDTRGAVS